MPRIHVCSLARLPETVERCRASHLVTLISAGTAVARPAAIAADRHLLLSMHDITEMLDGMEAPAEAHVRDLLSFVAGWERDRPMVIHCWAGISRSTAAGFITACALLPERDEAEIALALRRASPTASPNRRLVAIADALLGRAGRMVGALQSIGPGALAPAGEPFAIDIGSRPR